MFQIQFYSITSGSREEFHITYTKKKIITVAVDYIIMYNNNILRHIILLSLLGTKK